MNRKYNGNRYEYTRKDLPIKLTDKEWSVVSIFRLLYTIGIIYDGSFTPDHVKSYIERRNGILYKTL